MSIRLEYFFNFEGKTSGLKNLNVRTAFSSVDLPRFSRHTQDQITEFLSSLDRKIALNRRKIATLEKMAKEIYDYWFVQYDFPDANGRPYKSSGGKMVWNDQLKREVPEGWDVGNLYDIATYDNGLACQRYRPAQGESSLPVIKIKEMHDGICSDSEVVSANISAKHLIKDGDLLFSWSASLEVMIWCGGNGGLNQHIFKVTPKENFSTEYVLRQISSYLVNFKKIADARKTTMGHITTDHLKQSRIIIPSVNGLKHFNEVTVDFVSQRIVLQREIRVLTHLRESLLPLLMNGQVKVGQ